MYAKIREQKNTTHKSEMKIKLKVFLILFETNRMKDHHYIEILQIEIDLVR